MLFWFRILKCLNNNQNIGGIYNIIHAKYEKEQNIFCIIIKTVQTGYGYM